MESRVSVRHNLVIHRSFYDSTLGEVLNWMDEWIGEDDSVKGVTITPDTYISAISGYCTDYSVDIDYGNVCDEYAESIVNKFKEVK